MSSDEVAKVTAEARAAMIHVRFEPRIWLAGRRLMSTSTAVLRKASPIAAAMISLRLLSLRSLYRVAQVQLAAQALGHQRLADHDVGRCDQFGEHR